MSRISCLLLRTVVSGAAILCAAAATAQAQAPRVKPGHWRPGDEPPGWVRADTEHYEVQSEIPRERARIVAMHLEAMEREYRRRFPSGRNMQRFVLKIFADEKQYLAYGHAAGSLAYYNNKDDELVCFDTGTLDGNDKPPDPAVGRNLKDRLKGLGIPEGDLASDDLEKALTRLSTIPLLGVLSHEGWHQYFHFWIVSQVDFPSWLDEGMGDYFSSARVSKDGKTVACGDLNPVRFAVIWGAIKTNQSVPVKDLIQFAQKDYYKNPSVCYAEGWSLVYFCYHGGNERYAKIPDKLISVFKDKHKMKEATEAAFRGIDLDKFEQEWKAFYMGMDFVRTILDLGHRGAGGGETGPRPAGATLPPPGEPHG